MNIQFEKILTVNNSNPYDVIAKFSGEYQKQPEKWVLKSIMADAGIDLLNHLSERGKSWITKRNEYKKINIHDFAEIKSWFSKNAK
mgnify:FL=1